MGRRDDYIKYLAQVPLFSGCSQDELKSTGGDGLLYCFAVN